MSQTDDPENPYFVIAPAFPKSVMIAGIIWIIIGGFMLLLLAWMALVLALPTSTPAISPQDTIVTYILFAVVLGSFAFGFIFVGIRTAAGNARDTLVPGIGSTFFGCLYLVAHVAMATTAPANDPSIVVELCFGFSAGTALLASGILALVRRKCYLKWRKAKKAKLDWQRAALALADVGPWENEVVRPTTAEGIQKPEQTDDHIH
jgi:hypothetical protein